MQVTTRYMRKAVAGWLLEEKATVEQATELQSALYAGAVAGGTYNGNRPFDESLDFINVVTVHRKQYGDVRSTIDAEGSGCGCLLDTLERAKGGRPRMSILGTTAEAFALALTIGLGDTPSNSKWARAAARGINDYVATLEPA